MKHASPTDRINQRELDDLERRIREECEKGVECGLADPNQARAHFAALAELHEQRSLEQVELMERTRGLRA
jgi:hypothetical protein